MRKMLYNIYQKLNNRDVNNKLEKLLFNQTLSKDEIKEIQKIKLYNLLIYAVSNVPYYIKMAKKNNIYINKTNPYEALENFEILTKETVNKFANDLENKKIKEKIHLNYSGGSTGKPVKIKRNQSSYDYASASAKRSDLWAGHNFYDSSFIFWGANRDFRNTSKDIISKLVFKKYKFNTFNWTDEKILEIYKLLKIKKPHTILSYASSLSTFVCTLKKFNIPKSDYKPKSIIVSADMLYDFQRAEIEDFFNTKIFNRYGCREVGVIASECPAHNGLHISEDTLYVEIVDDKGNKTNEGQIGNILITDLTNYAMPLIRYKIEDLGSYKNNEKCICDIPFNMISSLNGRVTENIVTPEGIIVNGAALSTLVPRMNNIKQLQLIQEAIDFVKVKVVKNENFSERDQQDLINTLKNKTSFKIQYEVEFVDRIINEKSGKFRFIINDINNNKFKGNNNNE